MNFFTIGVIKDILTEQKVALQHPRALEYVILNSF